MNQNANIYKMDQILLSGGGGQMEDISLFLHGMESSDPHFVQHLLTVVAGMAADPFPFYFIK